MIRFALCTGLAGVGLVVWWNRRRVQARNDSRSTGIKIAHLTNPDIRANHLDFNKSLLKDFPDTDAIKVDDTLGGVPIYLVHRHHSMHQVLSNHEVFTSDPWLGSRPVVALNTMEKPDHDRILRILKKYYSPSGVASWEELVTNLVGLHGEGLRRDGDVYKFSKRLHMHLSLHTSGLYETSFIEDPLIDQFIEFNDTAVFLAAPVGGVGTRPSFSYTNIANMFRGIIKCLPHVIALVQRIGIYETWKLLGPIETLFPSPPYTQCWEAPELLHRIPAYFVRVYDLMSSAREDSPASALFAGIGSTISASEGLATAVQLMVNMTTANAIMSLVYRLSENLHIKPDEVLVQDAPLQRNPRRAKRDTMIGSIPVPKGAIVLLMIGASNEECPGNGGSTFGFGLHHCLGRHLVRMELSTVHEWLIDSLNGKRVTVLESVRLVDRDVGNWGFSRFHIVPLEVS